eukprot:TRINITY_DN6591_c0_g1_i1.p1 TRINITY_DN6591_c0_g1~~TRINITY_DN6591_c0_g1_i1.p1  ORF type:complete len:300 (+),score=79.52 TRINITY_DN6591_c0_g1_i1:76-975(+)
MSINFTPINRIQLTNIVVVRLKKGGKRFEIACYPNKVSSWRNKVEKDIEEVLQSHAVFLNVQKGQVARKEDLEKAFGFSDMEKACLEILAKGELQVSEKERQLQQDSMFKDIATIVADKCVNPETRRPYPVGIIERAMHDMHFAVKPAYNAKQQALAVIKELSKVIPLSRAQMRLRLTMPAKDGQRLKDKITAVLSTVESEDWDEKLTMVALADPGNFRALDDLVRGETKGRGVLEVVNLAVVEEGVTQIDDAVSTPAGTADEDTAGPAASQGAQPVICPDGTVTYLGAQIHGMEIFFS